VKKLVEAYRSAALPLARQVVGTIVAPLPNSVDAGGAAIAFTNPGGIRTPALAFAGAVYPYDVTYANAFAVQPFGNSLVTMTLTARQIKDLLEQRFVGCLGQATQRILQVSYGVS
jgi:5'-nucleotidase